MKAHKSAAELIDDIRSDGAVKIRSAARLMTLAEESSAKTVEILSLLAGDPMPRIILGITGAPGSGKSLLTGRLIEEFRKRYPKRMIGVVAVDPSSPFSGGAILGDRIRMMQHASDDKVFIRSLATHGQVGGVTEGTRGIVAIMGALGCDIVLVETVGVGQMEFAVREIADAVAVILAPGQGDTIQFLKAGLMEIGDMFIVNKSDCPSAAQFQAQLSHALRTLGRVSVPIRMTSARDNIGIADFFDSIEEVFIREHLNWETTRHECLERLVRRIILSEAQKRLERILEKQENISQKILEGEISLSSCLEKMIKEVK
jgi:LAO/AO transport system kinase